MLNSTVISAIQSLSPTWSSQVIKYAGLSSEYQMVIGLLISQLSKMIRIDDHSLLLLFGVVGTGYFVLTLVGMSSLLSWLRQLGLGTRKPVVSSNQLVLTDRYISSDSSSVNGDRSTIIDRKVNVIRNHITPRLSWKRSINGWSGRCYANHIEDSYNGESDYQIQDTQQPHLVKLPGLEFTIEVTSRRLATDGNVWERAYRLNFKQGSFKDLLKFDTVKLESYLFCMNQKYGTSVIMNKRDASAKLTDQVWHKYYYRHLPEFKSWIKRLEAGTIEQFSIICTGPPGTGKSQLIKRLAHYTQRHIVKLNMMESPDKTVKMQKLQQTLLMPLVYNKNQHPSQVIYEIDEFDKTFMAIMTAKRRDEQFYSGFQQVFERIQIAGKETTDLDVKKVREDQAHFSLDDLLTLFSGSCIPQGRIIVACANNIELIKKHCPALLRPGRLTIFEFDYGNRDMLLEMAQDYGIELDREDVPSDYQFVQAGLLEWLNSHPECAPKELLSALPRFVPEKPEPEPEPEPEEPLLELAS